MSLKSKIISVLLLIILVVPVFLLPFSQGGNVAGVNEDRTTQTKTTSETNSGAIAGGVSDVKNTTLIPVKGVAVLDENLTNPVINNKFNLSSQIQVETASGKTILQATKKDLPDSEDTVMVLDKQTFTSLGGNLETKAPISVRVTSK